MQKEGNVFRAEHAFERHQREAAVAPELARTAIISELRPADEQPPNIPDQQEAFITRNAGTVLSILFNEKCYSLYDSLHHERLNSIDIGFSADELQQLSWDFLQEKANFLYKKYKKAQRVIIEP